MRPRPSAGVVLRGARQSVYGSFVVLPAHPARLSTWGERESFPTRPRLLKGAIAFAAGVALATSLTPRASAQEWEFAVSPYFWASGLQGDIAPLPLLPAASVDESFSDIWDDLNFGFMSAFEVRRDRIVFLGDFSYADTHSNGTIRGDTFRRVDVDADTLTTAAAGGFRIYDSGTSVVDLFGGARLTWTDTTLDLTRIDDSHLIGDSQKSWVDGLIGVRGIAGMSEQWSLTGYADIAGLSSEFAWQAYGAVNYHITDNGSVSFGYRVYDVDYEDEGFIYDVQQSGPIVGGTFRF